MKVMTLILIFIQLLFAAEINKNKNKNKNKNVKCEYTYAGEDLHLIYECRTIESLIDLYPSRQHKFIKESSAEHQKEKFFAKDSRFAEEWNAWEFFNE